MLDGWDVEDRTIVRQADESHLDAGRAGGGERAVAMVTAVRPSAG